MGFAAGWLVADCDAHVRWAFADGVCPLTWRQGIKHDAAAVMELERDPDTGFLCNGAGEIVDVEPSAIYPLTKGSDLKVSCAARRPSVPCWSHRSGSREDTALLEGSAPRLWSYLQAHAAAFTRRKSSIYRGQPMFSLFGVGPYSFAPFKVAISGLHKEPAFKALAPVNGRPMMLDDTCYFLPCASAGQAAVLAALCNDPITIAFVRSASFRDSKRPITKKLLQRIDLPAILKQTDRGSLLERATSVLCGELGGQSGEPLSELVAGMERRIRTGFDLGSLSSPWPFRCKSASLFGPRRGDPG